MEDSDYQTEHFNFRYFLLGRKTENNLTKYEEHEKCCHGNKRIFVQFALNIRFHLYISLTYFSF